MQKQRIVEVEHAEDNTIAFPAPRARPLRLALAASNLLPHLPK